jgi:ketosteroid isomerase-like protein
VKYRGGRPVTAAPLDVEEGEMADEIQVVKTFYDSLVEGDVPKAFSILDPDVEWNVPEVLPYGGTYHGPESVRGYRAQIEARLEEGFRLTPEEFLSSGERVVVLGRLRGRARTTGLDVDVPFAHIWTVSEGKVVARRYVVDTATLLRAFGEQQDS